ATCRYLKDWACRSVNKQNGAILAPCASARADNVADGLRRPALQCNSFQFAALEIADKGAVGRPERIGRAFGAGHWPRFAGVEHANPQTTFSRAESRSPAGRNERDRTAIGRNTKCGKPRIGRRNDLEFVGLAGGWYFPKVNERQTKRRQEKQRRSGRPRHL